MLVRGPDRRSDHVGGDCLALTGARHDRTSNRLAGGGDREPEFVSAIARDVSLRRELEAQLRAKARHDPLTGLPNRVMFSERLEHAVADGAPVALLFLDLDQFKVVNDTQGHDTGDQLLVAAADRLRGEAMLASLVSSTRRGTRRTS